MSPCRGEPRNGVELGRVPARRPERTCCLVFKDRAPSRAPSRSSGQNKGLSSGEATSEPRWAAIGSRRLRILAFAPSGAFLEATSKYSAISRTPTVSERLGTSFTTAIGPTKLRKYSYAPDGLSDGLRGGFRRPAAGGGTGAGPPAARRRPGGRAPGPAARPRAAPRPAAPRPGRGGDGPPSER